MRHPASLCSRLVLIAALSAASTGAALANSITVPNGALGGQCNNVNNPNSARFAGFCGALVSFDGSATATYVEDRSPSAEVEYHVRFYVNARNVDLGGGGDLDIFDAYDGTDGGAIGNAVLRVKLTGSGTTHSIQGIALLDGAAGTATTSTIPLPRGWRSIELDYKTGSAGAGHLDIWLNGFKCDGTDHHNANGGGPADPGICNGTGGITNSTRTINFVRWGAPAITSAPANLSTLKLDSFASQRTGYIGRELAFSDIGANVDSSNVFAKFEQGVYAAEVIPDCGVGTFCNGSSISRQEMAMFTLKGREGSSYTPPACTSNLSDPDIVNNGGAFTDVPCPGSGPTAPYADWIYEFAARGITVGCSAAPNPHMFCPTDTVNRGTMAVFLIKAHDGAINPPDCTTDPFTDVPANIANPTPPPSTIQNPICKFIKAMVDRNITAGCGGGKYCQTDPAFNPVTRAQMSVFMLQDFGDQNGELQRHVLGP